MSNFDSGDVRREVGGLSIEDITALALATAKLYRDGDQHVSDLIVDTLDKYEKEIVRLRQANARLKNKNRNYRTGIKNLQRAHESTLHRLAAVKDTAEQYRAVAAAMAGHGGCGVYYDGDGPYTPVRFNNEAPIGSFETVPASRVD